MATRQYIGARYVPKFYQNSVDGSTQWESNVVYDPLIWVTLQNGHMYISKKQVPATVGTPAENIDYWLDVGSYDGYIQSLQEQIDAVNDDIDDMKDGNVSGSLQNQINELDDKIIDRTTEFKKVIFISDSYGGYGSTPLLDDIASHLGLSSSNYVAAYEGSSGFVHTGTSGHTFLTLLQTINTFAVNDVSHVIVLGGLNDVGEASATLQAAVQSFITYVRSHYPNCEVQIGFIGNVRDATKVRNLGAAVVDISVATSRFDKARVLPKLEYVLKNNYYMSSDGVHPSNDGVEVLAHYCATAIRGKEINPMYYKAINATQGGVNFTFWQSISNGVFTMWTNNMRIYDFATPQTWSPDTTKDFFDVLSDSLCMGSYYQDFAQEMPITVVNNGSQFTFTAAVIFYNGKLQIRPLESFTTLTSVTRVYFPQFLISMDAKFC